MFFEDGGNGLCLDGGGGLVILFVHGFEDCGCEV